MLNFSSLEIDRFKSNDRFNRPVNVVHNQQLIKSEKEILKRSKEITRNYFQFLDKHIADVVSGKVSDFMEINQVARELYISHKHLTNTVQKETGCHPCHFYDQKILDKAKQMLLQSDESVSEVARILTYDPSNFSKFFKKMTGITPGQFRNSEKKK